VQSKNLLLIFTRNPELGKCKTRLAATVGNETALEIYKFLLQHTVSITKNIHAVKQVYYSEEIWEKDVWNTTIFEKKLQNGANLGDRMANAFELGFKNGFEKILVIGSDLYDLDATTIENAFSELDKSDFVIGPAQDGGYYLLGMKKFITNVFKNKAWGTHTVLNDTLKNLEKYKTKLLDVRNDVDVYEDIKDISAFNSFLKK